LFASVVPVLLGTAVATFDGHSLHLGLLLQSLIGCLTLHAGANVANDYYDWLSGADGAHQPWHLSGGSQLLQGNQLTPRQVRLLYRLLYLLALSFGIYISLQVGMTALCIGLVGLLLGYFYTAPPVAFSYRGLGELVTGITFGPLAVTGAYFVQSGSLEWFPLLVSLPVGLLITAVLYINEFPDYLQDKAAGKNTWVVLTCGRSMWIYQLMVSAALLATLGLLLYAGWWLFLLSLPFAWLAWRPLRSCHQLSPEALFPLQRHTLKLHAVTCVALALLFFLVGPA
jgi:1,4-dihydroxy-2-naphthoate octaprenyltransferase